MPEQSVPVYGCDITSMGRVITLNSWGYGIFNPARMDLPKSLMAVVHSVISNQNEEQDFIIAVQADRVRDSDFSPYAPASQQFNFNLEDKSGKAYSTLEENEALSEDEIYDQHFDIQAALVEERKKLHPKLVGNIEHFGRLKGLGAPFLEQPELANYKVWLEKALPNWEDEADDPIEVPLPYTNTEILGCDSAEPFPPQALVADLSGAQKEKLDKEEAQLQEQLAADKKREAERIARLDASIAAAKERENTLKAETTPEEMFEICDGEGDFEPLFNEADKYKDVILSGLEAIKGNYFDGNPVTLTDEMPQWLVDWFTENQVAMCGKRTAAAATSEVVDTFSGKRVCVTGKLSQTRTEIEAALEEAGATIASAVSKTTDVLIAGEDSGSKLAKANELGIQVMTESEMNVALGQTATSTVESDAVFDQSGVTFNGVHYSYAGEHEVYVIVDKAYWDANIKGKANHVISTDTLFQKNGTIGWCPEFDVCGSVDEDLCVEMFGEDGPTEWLAMNEEQQEMFAEEVMKRDAYEYMRCLRITGDLYSDETEEMDDDLYAHILGLDPKHTHISYQG